MKNKVFSSVGLWFIGLVGLFPIYFNSARSTTISSYQSGLKFVDTWHTKISFTLTSCSMQNTIFLFHPITWLFQYMHHYNRTLPGIDTKDGRNFHFLHQKRLTVWSLAMNPISIPPNRALTSLFSFPVSAVGLKTSCMQYVVALSLVSSLVVSLSPRYQVGQ